MSAVKICAVVPTYQNPLTVEAVVAELLEQGLQVIVVDDGSDPPGQQAAGRCALLPGVFHVRREQNGGKGRAVVDGFARARALGFTHALQVDADGQHCLSDVGRFVKAAEDNPNALILGQPLFDASVPKGRLHGRKISVFWCRIETLSRKIEDPLCGFRVYPLQPCAALGPVGNRMDFDPEIAVRLVWAGVPTVNLKTKVRYLSPEEGGVSHFHMLRDNVRISWMHTRLVTWGIILALTWPFRRVARALSGGAR